jgi:hypothetical protein
VLAELLLLVMKQRLALVRASESQQALASALVRALAFQAGSRRNLNKMPHRVD